MTFMTLLILSLFISCASFAGAPGLDTYQMERLIRSSEKQLEAARELIQHAQQDTANQQRALSLLEQMSKGIEQQIKPLQGSPMYDQALLKLQEDPAGSLHAASAPPSGESEEQARKRENFTQFQAQSHRADLEDLANRDKLAEALIKAQPGFVPKLQTQAELGQWETNVRISAKLTELLGAIQGLRHDLRGQRNNDTPEGFGLFLSGANEQSKKLRGEVKRGR